MSFEVKNLVKSYGNKVVVDNLSFRMDKPGVYALLGTNGAGKTTSIRIILGMLQYDSGEVLWDDKPMNIAERNVGYLAEERGLYPKYSLLDQLMYFAELKRVPKATALQRIHYWSGRLGLDEYFFPVKPEKGRKKTKSNRADQLSKGNQQKIQLMAALLSDPELLVLDEPLSGLDPVNSDLFKDVIHEEMDKGKYIILSSHGMATIEEFTSDLTILNRGKVVLQGNLDEIKKSYGRINLMVKCDSEIAPLIEEAGLTVVEKLPSEYHLRVSGEEEANNFLRLLMERKVTIVRFELREPSLHEIFVEKVSAAEAETGEEAETDEKQ